MVFLNPGGYLLGYLSSWGKFNQSSGELFILIGKMCPRTVGIKIFLLLQPLLHTVQIAYFYSKFKFKREKELYA